MDTSGVAWTWHIEGRRNDRVLPCDTHSDDIHTGIGHDREHVMMIALSMDSWIRIGTMVIQLCLLAVFWRLSTDKRE
jgi:hypothetical protein